MHRPFSLCINDYSLIYLLQKQVTAVTIYLIVGEFLTLSVAENAFKSRTAGDCGDKYDLVAVLDFGVEA